MKYLVIISIIIPLSLDANSQILTGSGMVYEDDPKHDGYVKGKIYDINGKTQEGLVLFPYTHGDIRFKPSEDSEFQKFSAKDLNAFTMKSDSFAVITNFGPEIIGTTLNTFFERGFAKVLIDGPIALYKHYSIQSISNMQIVTVESFILARKEELYTRFTTIPTSKRDFTNAISDYFKRDSNLISKIKQTQPSFLQIRDIVKEYNKSYSVSEQLEEESNVIIFRPKKKERADPLHIYVNDSIEFELDIFDLNRVKTFSRINKICIEGGNCLLFRADHDIPHFIQCSFNSKLDEPQVLYVHPQYADPIVNSIHRKKN